MKKITIILPYYNSPRMLEKQIECWQQYPSGADLIVIDDGSPKYPALDVIRFNPTSIPVQLYRIKENIPWNHGGARNLGFTHASEGWCVMTDIDHIMFSDSVRALLAKDLDEERSYKFRRFQNQPDRFETIGPHSSSFLLTRQTYWDVGGFNEDFSGYWNGVGRLFRTNLRKMTGEQEVLQDVSLVRYLNHNIEDAEVTEWGRAGSAYDIKLKPELYKRFRKSLRNYHPVNPLRYTWERLI